MRAQDHPNEPQRLRATRETGLLDGPQNALHEAVVLLASEICGVPISAVSLIDSDRQWFSGIHGLDCRETSRDAAFCAHTILQDVPLVVHDATSDPRFADNPLVTSSPAIRFYAGVPLITASHLPVGSLCVIDTIPRELSETQLKSLSTLATLVAAQLDSTKRGRELEIQRQAQHEIINRMDKIASRVPGVIYQFVLRPDGSSHFPYASNALAQIYRLSPEQVREDASAVFETLHPDDFAMVQETIAESATQLTPWQHEYRVRFADGTVRWLYGDATPERMADGGTLWHGFITDITDRRLAEQAFRENADRLGLAAGVAQVGVWDWCIADEMVTWDSRMFELYGMEPTSDGILPFSKWRDAVHPDDVERQIALLSQTVESRRRGEREFRMVRADGEIRIIQSAEVVVLDELDRPDRVVGVNRDVTEQREFEARLRDSHAVIERQNAELSIMAERAHRVVDDVSHEFRTPLAVIKEFAAIIADGIAGPVSADQATYLGMVDSAVIDLNHLVEDLLDSSKLRAGRLRVDRVEHSIQALIDTSLSTLESKAKGRSISIEQRIHPDLPTVFADEEKVRRVINNLMTNAIKFTPEGGSIVISAAPSSRQDEIVVTVKDSGPGLSEESIRQLFGRFRQVSSSRRVAAKGFGLGLNIAHELTWLNLGELSVQSREGDGAEFSFTLPTFDLAGVISHYFRALGSSEGQRDQFAIIRVRSDQAGDPDELRAFLASATYPTDLVLPASWHSDDEPMADGSQTLWLLGRTKSRTAWLSRLDALRSQLVTESPRGLAPLSFSVEGIWNLPLDAEQARRETHSILGVVPSHG